jgi:hypothetical protein
MNPYEVIQYASYMQNLKHKLEQRLKHCHTVAGKIPVFPPGVSETVRMIKIKDVLQTGGCHVNSDTFLAIMERSLDELRNVTGELMSFRQWVQTVGGTFKIM